MGSINNNKDAIVRAAVVAALIAAAAVSIPALLVAAPAVNFALLQFVWRGGGKTGVSAVPGRLLLAGELFLPEIAGALSLFALFIIVGARGAGGMAAVAAAFFLAAWLFSMFYGESRRDRAIEIAGRSTVAAAALVFAALLVLDHFILFPFLLAAAACFFIAVLSIDALTGALALIRIDRLSPAARRRLRFFAVALPLALYFSLMNLSALGRYRFFAPGVRYKLKPSLRAGINSHGFRGPEIRAVKPRGAFRVITAGDSATYGWLVTEPESWPRLLEHALRGRGNKFEVLNAGVPSYSMHEMNRQLQDRLTLFDPDLIVVMAGANDARKFSPARFKSSLDDYVSAAKSHRISVMLCTYPYPSRQNRKFKRILPYNGNVRAVARERGLPLFDAYELMRGKNSLFYTDGHPNVRGHAYLAQNLADFVMREYGGSAPGGPVRIRQMTRAYYN
jgi:lysophospholipase L1-like esterase